MWQKTRNENCLLATAYNTTKKGPTPLPSSLLSLSPTLSVSHINAWGCKSWSRQVKSSQVKFIYIAHFKTTVVDQSAVHKYNIFVYIGRDTDAVRYCSNTSDWNYHLNHQSGPSTMKTVHTSSHNGRSHLEFCLGISLGHHWVQPRWRDRRPRKRGVFVRVARQRPRTSETDGY